MIQAARTHAVTVAEVRFEHVREPVGLGAATPRLSWTTLTDTPNWQQAAYEVELTGQEGSEPTVSGSSEPTVLRIESGDSVLVPWPFAPLTARDRATVRVRVTGSDGAKSAWSEPATVETGLLAPDDWSASFITPDWEEDPQLDQPSPFL
ncbi:hypothetical protein AB4212_50945, partial [Streptomyces sp. 2MCAF27]